MNGILTLFALLILAGTLEPVPSRALAAGPYEGFGASTLGGAGGSVVRVTNLNDSGPGSFREAVAGGNRTVVFDVAGDIVLASQLHVTGAFVTIDGFTAPPPGITLRNNGLSIHGTRGAHDVVVRGLRIRNASTDGISIKNGAYNVVIDHCSVHGSADGNLDITEASHDVTVSWSVFAEPRGSQKNSLIKYNPSRITLHHNVFVAARKRNPLVAIDNAGTPAADTTIDMRNNVVWDWGDPDPAFINYGTLVSYGARANVVNNFYSAPTASAVDQARALIVCEGDCYAGDLARYDELPPAPDPLSRATAYVSGNISADALPFDINSEGNQLSAFDAAFVATQDACVAAALVVADAGARPLDPVDQGYLARISLGLCFTDIADLAVVTLSPPAFAAPGATVAVSEATQNRGQGPTPEFSVTFYFSADATLDTGDVLLGSRTPVPSLGTGETSAAVTSMTLPTGIAPGTYYILAWADPDDVVPEPTDVNNLRYAAITVGSNLIASALTTSTSAGPGTTIAVSDTVVNGGLQSPTETTVRFYLSTDPAFDAGDVPLGSRIVPVIVAGATSSAVTSLTIPALTGAGVYYVLAYVDPDKLIGESSETDNLRAAAVTITVTADLVIKIISAPGTAAPGSTISVSDTVQNSGKGPAPGSIVTFRLSTNNTYEAGDRILNSRLVPPLASRASHTSATQVTIPLGTTPGNYYIVARVEPENGALEISAANNTQSSRRLKVR